MKITTPLLALVGALAVASPNLALAAPSETGAHLVAKTEKEKKEDAQRAKRNKQERREDARERREDRQERREDARERVEDRRDRAQNIQERREDARERAEDRQERREDARERAEDRRDRVQDRQAALRHYRANVRERQRERFASYYRNAYARHSCPPGLRREYGGCYPRGWNRNYRPAWRLGYALPTTVVYYDLPTSIYGGGYIEPAPYGYRYVQVGNDILLIEIATRLIVDSFAIY